MESADCSTCLPSSRPNLLECALSRGLLRPPAQELGSVAETSLGKVIVGDLAHHLWLQRFPLPAALRAPAAGPPGRASGKTAAAAQRFHDLLQLTPLFGGEARSKAYVIQFPLLVVQAEQQRAHGAAFGGISKASHHAIGAANALDLDHGGALAGGIRGVQALCDHAVEAGPG